MGKPTRSHTTTVDGVYQTAAINGTSPEDDAIYERIGAKTAVRSDGCWIYDDRPDTYNYLSIRGEQVRVHRWVCEQVKGVPPGYHVHHFCGTKGCINPQHLIPLSPSHHSTSHGHFRSVDAKRARGIDPYQ